MIKFDISNGNYNDSRSLSIWSNVASLYYYYNDDFVTKTKVINAYLTAVKGRFEVPQKLARKFSQNNSHWNLLIAEMANAVCLVYESTLVFCDLFHETM